MNCQRLKVDDKNEFSIARSTRSSTQFIVVPVVPTYYCTSARLFEKQNESKAKQPPIAISENKQSTNAHGNGLVDASMANILSINYNDWTDFGHSMHESICSQIKHRICVYKCKRTSETTKDERSHRQATVSKKSAQPNQLCSKVDRVCIQIV